MSNHDSVPTGATGLSHVDADGTARMVDVTSKPSTVRTAKATGFVRMAPATVELLRKQALPKGDVLTVARIAGIQAAKRCGDWIPLCHPLPLTDLQVSFTVLENAVRIDTVARCIGPTGVEMEALTAVTAAALTVVDMCKAVDKEMVLDGIRVVEKTGGSKGDWNVSEASDASI
jgi:cyclic pyranopterin phosphate synthase